MTGFFIYLAAPYSAMLRMREWEAILRANGHVSTAKWVSGNEEGMSLNDAAQMDLDDVDTADVVISMALPKGTMFSSGGRHVEFGYGLARGKMMIVVNSGAENIFHELDRVVKVPSIEAAMEFLRTPAARAFDLS